MDVCRHMAMAELFETSSTIREIPEMNAVFECLDLHPKKLGGLNLSLHLHKVGLQTVYLYRQGCNGMWRQLAKQAFWGGDYAPFPRFFACGSSRFLHVADPGAVPRFCLCVSVQLNFKKMQCLLWALYCLMDMHHDLLPVQEPKGVLPIAGTPPHRSLYASREDRSG